MVLDTSALLAILLGEPEAERFADLLASADDPIISAATLVESFVVMLARKGPGGIDRLGELLESAAVRTVAVNAEQARVAIDGFTRFGEGRSRATLNLGDCFAYALARASDRALLFEGEGFARTDVRVATLRLPRSASA